MEVDMNGLKENEILDALQRLGIHNPVDRVAYFNDYLEYASHNSDSLMSRFIHTMRKILQKKSLF